MKETIQARFNSMGIILTNKQVNQFDLYMRILQEWNKNIDLTAVDDDLGILERHFIDSASLLKGFDIQKHHKVIDVGTGAGFPGIPISIITGCEMTLLDALNKRVKFLEAVIAQGSIDNISVIHGRAEDYGQDPNHRESYDLVVARAVASLNVLIEYTIPFLKVGGILIAQKSKQTVAEIEQADKAMDVLGCKVVNVITLENPDNIQRTLIIIEKTKKTPKNFPRKAGTPNKEPIVKSN